VRTRGHHTLPEVHTDYREAKLGSFHESASVGRFHVRCALSEKQWHSRRLLSGEARAP